VISKVFGAASIAVGGTTSLTFTIQNPNPATPFTGVVFSDNMPAGLLMFSAPATACGAGTVTVSGGGKSISLSGGTMAPNGVCTFSVTVLATSTGTKTNTTSTVISNEGGAGNVATATIIVNAATAPVISKVFGAAAIAVGGTTSLTFTIHNPNAAMAFTGVAFTDTMPSGLVMSNAPATACGAGTVGGGGTSISLSGGTMAPNGVCTFSVTVAATSAGTKTNTTSTVSSNKGGAGNVATATIIVNGTAASTTAALTSSANPSSVGQSVTFTVKITSGGGTPSGTVNFADGGTLIATVTLTAGSAAFTISSLAAGTHPIIASYGGSAGFTSSASPTLTQTVQGTLDSTRLRSLQLVVNKIEAQSSGTAFDGAVSDAIADGFNDGGGALITPNGNGVRFNFAADPETTAQRSGRVADQYDSVSATRAAMLSNSGPNDLGQAGLPPSVRSFAAEAPPGTAGRVDDAFAALAFDKTVVTKAPPLPPAPKVWLLWADVRGTGWDTSAAAGDIRGGQINAIVGLTRKLAPDLLVGILAGYENFDYTSQTLNGRLKGDGWTAGAYLGWRIWPGVRFDAAVGRSGVSYDGMSMRRQRFRARAGSAPVESPGHTGWRCLKSSRRRACTLSGNMTALTPTASARRSPTIHLQPAGPSAGAKVTYPMAWVVSGTLAPYVGLYADYYFSSEDAVLLLPTDFVRGWAARTTAGVGYTGVSSARASIGGEVGGLGSQTFTVWSVRGRFSLPF
jgi:hypothetical protein